MTANEALEDLEAYCRMGYGDKPFSVLTERGPATVEEICPSPDGQQMMVIITAEYAKPSCGCRHARS